MKHSFTDIHHHLIYGVDDGPKDIRQTARMLRRAAEQGIGRIIATPHVTPGVVRCPVEDYQEKVLEINQLCAQLQLDIRVDLGAELLYTQQTARFLDEERIPTLAGSDRVLVEFSPDVSLRSLQHAVEQILHTGHLPVLAHMERYQCLSSSMRNVRALRENYDLFYQINAHSVLEGGFFQRRFVRRMLEEHLVDAIATDAHNTSSRPAQLKDAWQALCRDHGREYADYLTSGKILLDHT